jgi:transposase-like protein
MAEGRLSIPALREQLPTEAAAYELLERLRWNGQPVCPHCGSVAKHYFLTPANGTTRKTRTGATSQRRVWKCKDCRKQFSVLTGTIFHGTRISLRTWIMVVFEMCASKNGVAAREIERKYDLTPKSAWFMTQRIREAMKRDPLAGLLSGTVAADETWIGGKPSNRPKRKRPQRKQWDVVRTDKTPVLALVDRNTGEVRSRAIPNVKGDTLRQAIADEVEMGATVLHTDEAQGYKLFSADMKGHHSVVHARDEYVRGNVTTNQVEGFFSQLKRSIDGTHHHVSVEHLHRYLAEFDYRYTTRKLTDSDRMAMLMDRTGDVRLSYKPLLGRSE